MSVFKMRFFIIFILLMGLDGMLSYPSENLSNGEEMLISGVKDRVKRQSSRPLTAGTVLNYYANTVGFLRTIAFKATNEFSLETWKGLGFAAITFMERIAYNSNNEPDENKGDCMINIRLLGEDHALIISAKDHSKFHYPDRRGIISVASGEAIHLSCSQSTFTISNDNFKTVTCVEKNIFNFDAKHKDFYLLTCKQMPEFEIEEESLTAGDINVKRISFYFKSDSTTKLIYKEDTIDDEIKNPRVKHSKVLVPKVIEGSQYIGNEIMPKQSLNKDYLLPMTSCFDRETQSYAFELQLIKTKNNFRIDRTLCEEVQLTTPNSFVYAVARQSSSTLSNVAPQWKSIRTNNWAIIEALPAKLATKLDKDITVITGIHEWLQVRNIDDTGTKNLYLKYERDETSLVKEHPLSLYFFKIIIDKSSSRGSVFVTMNNPYIRSASRVEGFKNYEICADHSYPNLRATGAAKWEPRNPNVGYTYLCTVDNFYDGSKYPIRDDVTKNLAGLLSLEDI